MITDCIFHDCSIIQAFANSNGLRIYITEIAPNFSETTVVSSIYADCGGNVTDIFIGHLDELTYVSTTPISIAWSVFEQIRHDPTSKQLKPTSHINSQSKAEKSI